MEFVNILADVAKELTFASMVCRNTHVSIATVAYMVRIRSVVRTAEALKSVSTVYPSITASDVMALPYVLTVSSSDFVGNAGARGYANI